VLVKNDGNQRSFRDRFLNKKVLLIALLVVVVVGAGGGIYMLNASNDPAFCNSCHIMEPYYESWNDSNLLANKHAAEGEECHDCHEPNLSTQIDEGIKFVTGNYEDPLEEREFPREDCLECHDDFESIKAATNYEYSNPHDSHNGEQECTLCHKMHKKSEVMCAQCHYFGWIVDLDDSWNKDGGM
jgi:cytochrome c nitrite reductase small subunit